MAEQNNETMQGCGSEQGSDAEGTKNTVRGNAPENLAVVPQDFAVPSGSSASPLRLDQLPNEILIAIFARVEFSKRNLLSINLVCRHFRELAHPNDASAQPLYREVARLLFCSVAVYFGDSQYSFNEVGRFKKIHDQAIGIVTIVDSAGFQAGQRSRNFYHGLLLLQFIAMEDLADRCQLDTDHRVEQLWSPTTKLHIRYVCAVISEYLVRHLTASGINEMWVPDGIVQTRNAGHLASSLEHFVDYGFELRYIISVLGATFVRPLTPQNSRDIGDTCARLNAFGFEIRRLPIEVESRDPFEESLINSLEDWLLGRLPTDRDDPHIAFWLWRQQDIIDYMLYHTDPALGVPLLLCEYITSHNPRPSIPAVQSTYRDRFDQAGNHNADVKSRLAREDTGGEVSDLACYNAVYNFDWDAAINLEMLNPNSGLRRSMPSGIEALDKAVTAWREADGWVKPLL